MTLKPCPFCGGKAEYVRDNAGSLKDGWYIRCSYCGTRQPTWGIGNYLFLCMPEQAMEACKEKVEMLWNERVGE